MRRKNLAGFTVAFGMLIAGTQILQAAVPVSAKEVVDVELSSESAEESSEAESTEIVGGQAESSTITNEVQAIIDADNRIGSSLMEKLTADNKNVMISSYSIATALTLLSHCSEGGEQIDQLKEFLGMEDLTEDQILSAQKQLTEILGANKETEDTDEYGYPKSILETANAMYIDDELKTVDQFDDLSTILSDTYQASLERCDLSTEQTKDQINEWVNEKTHGLIKSILDEPMSDDVRMTLLNAVYFKAAWVQAFSEEMTDQQTFHGKNGDTSIDMMHQQDHFDYAENDDYQMIRMPYFGGSVMTVYLPKDVETADKWSESGYLYALELGVDEQDWERKEVALSMPKFEMEYGTQLKDILKELGIEKIFDGAFYDRLTDEKLAVGSVYHKTAIKNDENGTEAAAVTMMMVESMALIEPEEVVEMTIDHPFYFTISNTETGLKLFEGCVYNLD